MSNFSGSPPRPALGSVQRGTFFIEDGFAEASGTYLPGPTDAGVAVTFFRPPVPRRYPKET